MQRQHFSQEICKWQKNNNFYIFEDIFGLNIVVLPVYWRSTMSSSYFSRISSKLINFTEDEYIKGFAAAFEIKLVEKFCKIVLTSTTQANWKKNLL